MTPRDDLDMIIERLDAFLDAATALVGVEQELRRAVYARIEELEARVEALEAALREIADGKTAKTHEEVARAALMRDKT